MPKYTDYFVDGIWPKRRLNLVVGASGAGKTRWIIPQLYALLDGLSVLGRPTKPTKIAYVCCDRTIEDAKGTIESLGLDPERLPIRSFMDNEIAWTPDNVIQMIPSQTELVFIEAIAALVPEQKIIDYHCILKLGRKLNALTRSLGITFAGSTHTPKLKHDENFQHKRDNIIGSAAWAGICGTIVCIDEIDNGQREVHILPRDAEPTVTFYEFDQQGRLVEACMSTGRMLLSRWLSELAPDAELTTSLLQEKGQHYKLSRATVTRWIDDQIDAGILLKVDRGTFRLRPKQ